MKYRYSLLSLLFIFSIQFAFALSIKEAEKKGLISFKINENEKGTHYHSPLILTIANLGANTLNLELENGMTLVPIDPSEQNFIVTNSILVQLKPKEEKQVNVFAMCIEENDRAPSTNSSYKIGELANEDLRKLSGFIQKNKQFEPDAQFLMWDIAAGDYPSESINDFSMDKDGKVWILDEFGKALNGVVFDTIESEAPKPKLMVSGQFEMSFTKPKNVHIAMFNGNNVLVKELFKNPVTPIGKTSLNYEFNSYDYEEEVYYVKLVVNGEVLMTRTIEMSY